MRSLARGCGSCLAFDHIMSPSKGRLLNREPPDHVMDGGWRFFSGEETQEHAADASSFETYDLNTIANYDPDLVPYLDAPRAHGGRRRACASFARPLCTGRPNFAAQQFRQLSGVRLD